MPLHINVDTIPAQISWTNGLEAGVLLSARGPRDRAL